MNIIIIVIIILLFKIYISIKHPFWNRQPIFHIYKLHYWFKKGIIYKKFPKIDKKYYDLSLNYLQYDELSNNNKKKIQLFIKNNWNDEKLKSLPYMSTLDDLVLSKNKNSLKGVICGEMLKMNDEDVKYVDYLCINKNFRKMNITPKLIYNFFLHGYKNCKIILFKWENKNMNIIPLCVFNVLHYNNLKIKTQPINDIKIIQITKTNFDLIDFDAIKKKFNITFILNKKKILKQINDEYVMIYVSMINSKVVGLYFFYNYGNNYYNLYASVNLCNDNYFIYAFKTIINTFSKYNLSIDDISNSNILIKNINKIYTPYLLETHSYYFYNYIHIPEQSNDVLILS